MRISKNMRNTNYRLTLLSSVSALTLLGFAFGTGVAEASQADARPPVWLELGWQFESESGNPVAFMPPFTDTFQSIGAPSADIAQKAMAYSYGAESRIAFQPEGSDWAFSGSVRYGRAHAHKMTLLQTHRPLLTFHTNGHYGYYPPSRPLRRSQYARDFGGSSASSSDKHVIVDLKLAVTSGWVCSAVIPNPS